MKGCVYSMNTAKKENKQQKNRKRGALAIVLVAAILVTGIFAFLTAHQTKTNVFTVGKVEISLTEPNFDAENPNSTRTNILPGEVFTKDPTVTNSGANEAWIFATVKVPMANGSELFSYTLNDGWTEFQSATVNGDVTTHYYRLNAVLAPSSEVYLFKNNTVTFNDIGTVNYDAMSDTTETTPLNVVVDCYACQTVQNGSALSQDTAWTLLTGEYPI